LLTAYFHYQDKHHKLIETRSLILALATCYYFRLPTEYGKNREDLRSKFKKKMYEELKTYRLLGALEERVLFLFIHVLVLFNRENFNRRKCVPCFRNNRK